MWPIPDFLDYFTSENGEVYSKHITSRNLNGEFKLLKPWLAGMEHKKPGRGYLYVGLHINGKCKKIAIHRLVALTFIPNPNNYKEVNHKDGNKSNNHFSNLEWCSRSGNAKHAFDTGLNNFKPDNGKRPVEQLDRDGNLIRGFESIRAASRAVSRHSDCSSIGAACLGKRKTAYGFKWRFKQ